MSAIKQIISESRKRTEVDEFLQKELAQAGYGGVEITKTPLGTRVTIYAMKPGLVIGRGGEGIRGLSRNLEEKYKLFNPQIAVAEVPIPELNPHIMAAKVAAALERGVHFRRAAYWSLNGIMKAGALGAEIIIGGKLTTERARHEKFRVGYIPRVGDPVMKNLKKAVIHVQLKSGLFGIKVVIVPPYYKSPDQIEIKETAPATSEAGGKEEVRGEVATEPSTEMAAAEEVEE
jgi:small subunit ribosomal protein S3